MERDEDFSEYVSGRWTALTRSAVLLGCTAHEAEDLVQNTLAACYASWDKVIKARERDAYVYRVSVNMHAKSRRRRWWGEQPTADMPDHAVADQTRQVDDANAIRVALDALSPGHRAAVVLRYYGQLSELETAQALGVPPGTVKSRLNRALAQLSSDPNVIDLETEGTS